MNNNMNPITNNWLVIYNTTKQKRVNYLRKKFSGKKKNRKQPWFMLTKGKCFNFEERKEEWGQCINYYKVFSETKIFEKKNILHKKINHVEYMEGFTQHKLNKWIRHNPKPCKDDDLFALQYIPQWEKQKEEALEHFRNIVISIYDKINIYGRYKISDRKYTEGYPIKIGEIKDKNKELIDKSVNDLDESSKLLKDIRKIVYIEKLKHNNLVAGNIRDRDKKRGRLICIFDDKLDNYCTN